MFRFCAWSTLNKNYLRRILGSLNCLGRFRMELIICQVNHSLEPFHVERAVKAAAEKWQRSKVLNWILVHCFPFVFCFFCFFFIFVLFCSSESAITWAFRNCQQFGWLSKEKNIRSFSLLEGWVMLQAMTLLISIRFSSVYI